MTRALCLLLLGCAAPMQAAPVREPAYAPTASAAHRADACTALDGPATRRNRTVVAGPGVTLACY